MMCTDKIELYKDYFTKTTKQVKLKSETLGECSFVNQIHKWDVLEA